MREYRFHGLHLVMTFFCGIIVALSFLSVADHFHPLPPCSSFMAPLK